MLRLFLILLARHNTHRQGIDDYYFCQIDSLDHIHPQNIKLSKHYGCSYVIRVRKPKEFDTINESIKAAIGRVVFVFFRRFDILLCYSLMN